MVIVSFDCTKTIQRSINHVVACLQPVLLPQIQVKVKNNMAGLGSDAGSKKESGKKSKSHRWMEAKKRYEEIR